MASFWDLLSASAPYLGNPGMGWDQQGRVLPGIAKVFAAPGNAYQSTPDNPVTTQDMIAPAADLAGMITGGGFAAPAERNAVGMGIRAYHGSPYDFEKFDLSKIGTGEGAQAYGHGLYFAENPKVAQEYRDALTKQSPQLRQSYYGDPRNEVDKFAAAALLRNGDPMEARFVASNWEMPKGVARDDVYAAIERLAKEYPKPQGRMYEVNINAKPQQFLDWDKPLSQMSEPVRNALRGAWLAHPDLNQTGSQIYNATAHKPFGNYKTITDFQPEIASQELSQAGIPGIKYLDQGSRGLAGTKVEKAPYGDGWIASNDRGWGHYATKEEAEAFANSGTHNYVVFNPDIIDILKKYGLAGLLPAAGALAPPKQQAPIF
ncbi:MAG: hypothetical protein ACM3IH_10200 [Sphingobacteriales bacterium]